MSLSSGPPPQSRPRHQAAEIAAGNPRKVDLRSGNHDFQALIPQVARETTRQSRLSSILFPGPLSGHRRATGYPASDLLDFPLMALETKAASRRTLTRRAIQSHPSTVENGHAMKKFQIMVLTLSAGLLLSVPAQPASFQLTAAAGCFEIRDQYRQPYRFPRPGSPRGIYGRRIACGCFLRWTRFQRGEAPRPGLCLRAGGPGPQAPGSHAAASRRDHFILNPYSRGLTYSWRSAFIGPIALARRAGRNAAASPVPSRRRP